MPCTVLDAKGSGENKVFFFMKFAFQWGSQTVVDKIILDSVKYYKRNKIMVGNLSVRGQVVNISDFV